MRPINLIPAARIEQRRQRALLQRCVIVCVAYGALSLTAGIACRVLWGSSGAQLARSLDEAAGTVERTEKAISTVKLDLDATQQTLKASRSISEQPDWSIVLALLSERSGDDIVLRSCAVRQAEPPPEVSSPIAKPGKPAPKRPATAEPVEPSMSLTITGVGRPQLAVSQFVLRLEETRLFARVRLVETNRTTLDRLEAVAFVIECSLDDPSPNRLGRADQVASPMAGLPPIQSVRPQSPQTSPASAAIPTDEILPGGDRRARP